MSISAIGTGAGYIAGLTSGQNNSSATSTDTGFSNLLSGAGSNNTDPVVQGFLDFMNESPAQQMQDMWLAQHGISKKEFDAMSPEDKAKLIAKMKQEIEQQMKEKMNAANQKKGSNLDVLI